MVMPSRMGWVVDAPPSETSDVICLVSLQTRVRFFERDRRTTLPPGFSNQRTTDARGSSRQKECREQGELSRAARTLEVHQEGKLARELCAQTMMSRRPAHQSMPEAVDGMK